MPSRIATAQRMLKVAGVGPDQVFLDIGSGDGRLVVLAARAGAEAIGIDRQGPLVERARDNAAMAGVADRASFLHADALDVPSIIERADVVAVFLTVAGLTVMGPYLAEVRRPALAADSGVPLPLPGPGGFRRGCGGLRRGVLGPGPRGGGVASEVQDDPEVPRTVVRRAGESGACAGPAGEGEARRAVGGAPRSRSGAGLGGAVGCSRRQARHGCAAAQAGRAFRRRGAGDRSGLGGRGDRLAPLRAARREARTVPAGDLQRDHPLGDSSGHSPGRGASTSGSSTRRTRGVFWTGWWGTG